MDEDSDSPETSKPVAEDSKPSTPAESQKKIVKEHILKKMEEGQVGRLLRYKSGKTKLILGETQFDLDIGMETGFLQVYILEWPRKSMDINCLNVFLLL